MPRTLRAISLLVLLLLCPVGCTQREPFAMVPCSGRIVYDDGTPIPAKDGKLRLTFISQSPPVDQRTWPRDGIAEIDPATGTFDQVSSHKYGDGLVRGKHKVTVTAVDAQQIPQGIPRIYTDPKTTPLEVDTADQPFVLKIQKPR